MRRQAMRGLSSDDAAGPSVFKLVWANWHKRLGEVAMDVLGSAGLTAASGDGYDLDRWQRLFLFSLADTIYGGSDEVQRNILAERVLGLPREARG
jgi:alkylation response protein AidB-like acyl-CoA dehydrogenase